MAWTQHVVEVTCINPNDALIATTVMYRHVPNSIHAELIAAVQCDSYTSYNKRYDVVTGACGGIDFLCGLDGLFEHVGADNKSAEAMGWTKQCPILCESDTFVRMLILFDD
jgi:hypothetical protein